MTWFKVDDTFHSHPKVLAAPPAALGLWVVAGAWCSANLTDGFVPDYALTRLLPDAAQLASELVTAGLWRRAKGGYRFHDWSVYQPTKDEAVAARDRKSAGGRIGNHRRWHVEKGVTDPRCPYCAGSVDGGTDAGTDALPMGDPMRNRSGSRAVSGDSSGVAPVESAQAGDSDASGNRSDTDWVSESQPSPPDPTRPDPNRGGSSKSPTYDRASAMSEPPPRCPKHQGNPDPPPCGHCADARRTNQQWHADRRARQATAPQCRTHRGQPAHNCAPCRADRLAAEPAA